ncbi:unnamed protein product [Calypogeia fissa]
MRCAEHQTGVANLRVQRKMDGEQMTKILRLKLHKDEQVLEHGDEEEVCNNKTRLPEDLVERILAMVSFPFLFKARTLSKSWLAKFSPIESQDDKEKKMRAVSFQKQIEGALLFIPAIPNLFVVNILNRSWKQLPPHPHYVPWQESESQAQLVMSNGADGGETSSYEVIILSCGRGGPHPLQIYNSKSGNVCESWPSISKRRPWKNIVYHPKTPLTYWGHILNLDLLAMVNAFSSGKTLGVKCLLTTCWTMNGVPSPYSKLHSSADVVPSNDQWIGSSFCPGMNPFMAV